MSTRPNTVALRLSDEVVEWADRMAEEAGMRRSVWLAAFLQDQRDATPAAMIQRFAEPLVTHMTVDDLFEPPATEVNLENLGEPVGTPDDPAEHDGLLAAPEPPCSHPRAKHKVMGYATMCECGVRIR